VGFDSDELIRLWDTPPPADDGPFRALYADPVTINGRPSAPAPGG
jgi:hypothetical protein